MGKSCEIPGHQWTFRLSDEDICFIRMEFGPLSVRIVEKPALKYCKSEPMKLVIKLHKQQFKR